MDGHGHIAGEPPLPRRPDALRHGAHTAQPHAARRLGRRRTLRGRGNTDGDGCRGDHLGQKGVDRQAAHTLRCVLCRHCGRAGAGGSVIRGQHCRSRWLSHASGRRSGTGPPTRRSDAPHHRRPSPRRHSDDSRRDAAAAHRLAGSDQDLHHRPEAGAVRIPARSHGNASPAAPRRHLRQARLVASRDFGQIFITDTNRKHLDEIVGHMAGDFRMWTVSDGTFTPER